MQKAQKTLRFLFIHLRLAGNLNRAFRTYTLKMPRPKDIETTLSEEGKESRSRFAQKTIANKRKVQGDDAEERHGKHATSDGEEQETSSKRKKKAASSKASAETKEDEKSSAADDDATTAKKSKKKSQKKDKSEGEEKKAAKGKRNAHKDKDGFRKPLPLVRVQHDKDGNVKPKTDKLTKLGASNLRKSGQTRPDGKKIRATRVRSQFQGRQQKYKHWIGERAKGAIFITSKSAQDIARSCLNRAMTLAKVPPGEVYHLPQDGKNWTRDFLQSGLNHTIETARDIMVETSRVDESSSARRRENHVDKHAGSMIPPSCRINESERMSSKFIIPAILAESKRQGVCTDYPLSSIKDIQDTADVAIRYAQEQSEKSKQKFRQRMKKGGKKKNGLLAYREARAAKKAEEEAEAKQLQAKEKAAAAEEEDDESASKKASKKKSNKAAGGKRKKSSDRDEAPAKTKKSKKALKKVSKKDDEEATDVEDKPKKARRTKYVDSDGE